MRPAAAVVIVLAGCQFHHGGLAGDAGRGDGAALDGRSDAGIDAPPDAPLEPCLARWLDGTIRFTRTERIAGVGSTASDRDPFLTADELTLYFSSERGSVGNGNVYTASRGSLGDPFTAPAQFAQATTEGYDSKLSITDDGKLFVLASSHTGGEGGEDIWQATRSSTSATWSALGEAHEGNVNGPGEERDPALTPDGLALYLAVGATRQHIVSTRRSSTSSDFPTPQVITEIDATVGGADPAVSADERIIVFSSGRTGAGHDGNINLWYAVRADTSGAFGAPKPIPDVNTDADEGDPFLSRDGCRLYYDDDGNGFPDYELDMATAPQ